LLLLPHYVVDPSERLFEQSTFDIYWQFPTIPGYPIADLALMATKIPAVSLVLNKKPFELVVDGIRLDLPLVLFLHPSLILPDGGFESC
jgi:hypothetical protein